MATSVTDRYSGAVTEMVTDHFSGAIGIYGGTDRYTGAPAASSTDRFGGTIGACNPMADRVSDLALLETGGVALLETGYAALLESSGGITASTTDRI